MTKGLIFGVISITIVLLGWISLHRDFDEDEDEMYFTLFQGYIGLTIFEAIVKASAPVRARLSARRDEVVRDEDIEQ